MSAFAISELLVAVTCSSLAIIFFIFGHNKTQKLFAWFNVAVSGWGIFGFLAVRTADYSHSLFWARSFLVPVVFISVFIFHMYVSFSPPTPLSRIFLVFGYAQAVFFSLLVPTSLLISRVEWMFGEFYFPVGGPLYPILFVNWTLLVAAGHVYLFSAIRAADPDKKAQLAYLLKVSVLGFLGGIPNFFPLFGLQWYPYGNFLIPVYSMLTAYALYRHRFLDLNFVIRRTLLYSTLATLISLAILLAIIISEQIFKTALGYHSLPITILVALLIALGFEPLRNILQNFIDHYFFKGTAETLAKEKERLEAELKRTEKLRMAGTLAATLAHEIKNPLTSLKTFTTYLPEKMDDPVFMDKFREVAGSEIEKIDRLVKELLDFSKPKAPEMRPIVIDGILSHCVNLLQSECSRRGIRIVIKERG